MKIELSGQPVHHFDPDPYLSFSFWIVLFLLIQVGTVMGQRVEYEKNFLGPEFNLYKGALMIIDTLAVSGFEDSFYNDQKYDELPDNTHVVFPDPQNQSVSLKDSLIHRIFKVRGIINKNPEDISSVCLEDPVFILFDTLKHRTIYFRYNCEDESKFPFLVMKGLLKESNLCPLIEEEVDGYSHVVKMNSPLTMGGKICEMVLFKEITKKNSVYYLSLTAPGDLSGVSGVGVGILFADGTGMSKKAQVIFRPEMEDYFYSAMMRLTEGDINLLSAKVIKKYRLYHTDWKVDPKLAERIRIYARCLKKK